MSELPNPGANTSATQPRVISTEVWLSALLRYGVATSVSVILLGTLVSFWSHPEYSSSQEALAALTHPAQTAHSLSELLSRAVGSPGQTLIMFGLLMLMALPVARVLMSLWLFKLAGDRSYVRITAGVLVLLAVSFLVGALH